MGSQCEETGTQAVIVDAESTKLTELACLTLYSILPSMLIDADPWLYYVLDPRLQGAHTMAPWHILTVMLGTHQTNNRACV